MPTSKVPAPGSPPPTSAPPAAPKVQAIRQMAPRCSAIAGWMRARQDLAWTRRELAHVVDLVHQTGGMVPRTEKDHHPDAFASLWFVRAVHDFATVAMAHRDQHPSHAAYYEETLLSLCANIAQKFIAEAGVDGIRMDDSAVLSPAPAIAPPDHDPALRLNTLWYNALESTASALLNLRPRDPAGAHLERLAGRFRRSFPKTYWCADHKRVCTPADRQSPSHGATSDPDQLLLTALPSSPLPRTKQQLILDHFAKTALGSLGVRMNHPAYGTVESPLHLAWLAIGTAVDGDANDLQPLIGPLSRLRDDAEHRRVYAYYRNDRPLPSLAKPDPLATAEVLGSLQLLLNRGA